MLVVPFLSTRHRRYTSFHNIAEEDAYSTHTAASQESAPWQEKEEIENSIHFVNTRALLLMKDGA